MACVTVTLILSLVTITPLTPLRDQSQGSSWSLSHEISADNHNSDDDHDAVPPAVLQCPIRVQEMFSWTMRPIIIDIVPCTFFQISICMKMLINEY